MRRIVRFGWWSLLLVTIVAVYIPGLHGPYVFDDGPNIVDNEAVQIPDLSPKSLRRAALSGVASNTPRPLSMLSFGLNYALTGLDSFYFKLTNLVLHLVNVLLVGALASILIRHCPCFAGVRLHASTIALITAALWGLHPLQVSTTLYVVQRMTLLASAFTLSAMLLYAIGRVRQWQGRTGAAPIAVAVLICAPLAFLSKETGALFVAYAIVFELFAPMPASTEVRARIPTMALMIVICLGAAAFTAYLWHKAPIFAGAFYTKGFSMAQRMLTEPKALIWYLRMTLLPDVRAMGLTHDDWQASRSLLEPSTAAAMAAILLVIGSLARLRVSAPAAGFCIAWFLAGHSLEASPLPLDLVYEHRHYLPSFGIFLGLTALAVHGLAASSSRFKSAAALAFPLLLASLTADRVHEWRDPLQWGIAQAMHHPASAISWLYLGYAYAPLAEKLPDPLARQTSFQKADAAYAESFRLNPRSASAPVSQVILYQRTGREVPPERYDEIIATINKGAVSISSRLSVLQLLICAKDGECKMDSTLFMRIVNSALQNPSCNPFFCSQALALAAEFYGEREKDVDTAILMAKAATEVPGGADEVWLPLVRWLIVGNYLDQAAAALAQLDRVDRRELLRERREQFRKDLQERFQRAGREFPH